MSSYEEWMRIWKKSTIRDSLTYSYNMLEEQYNIWNSYYLKALESGQDINDPENIRIKLDNYYHSYTKQLFVYSILFSFHQ